MLCISMGIDARTHGICCIAVGDGAVARGAYSVVVLDKVTLPNDLPKDKAVASMLELREMKLTFRAMVDQKVAPPRFADESSAAIDKVWDLLEQHFDKKFDDLLEEVKRESNEKKEEKKD